MNILVIGGSRFVGPLVINRLVQNGHHVIVFNRGNISRTYAKEVLLIQGDRREGLAALSWQHFDSVIDTCAYVKRDVTLAVEQLDYDFMVQLGSVGVYGQQTLFPVTEDTPMADPTGLDDYEQGKIACENVLHDSDKPAAVVRADYILGANNYIDREHFLYKKIYTGEQISVPGDGQALCQFVFVQDVAELLVTIAERQLPGAVNCAGDQYITLNGLVEQMAKLVDKKPVITYNPNSVGASFDDSEFPFANMTLITSNQKAKDLGICFTPLLQGLHDDFTSYYSQLLR